MGAATDAVSICVFLVGTSMPSELQTSADRGSLPASAGSSRDTLAPTADAPSAVVRMQAQASSNAAAAITAVTRSADQPAEKRSRSTSFCTLPARLRGKASMKATRRGFL